MKKIILFIFMFSFIFLLSCTKEKTLIDNEYKDDDLWVYKEVDEDIKVDTFFLAPACTTGNATETVLDYNNEKRMSQFLGTVKMQKGIYDEKTRFFSPYYHQGFIYAFINGDEKYENEILDNAYNDVKNSFLYYLDHFNNGNKIILAGFSEGANLALRLLKDFIDDESFYNKYVACYAYGSLVSDEYLNSNKLLKMAEKEDDNKCIISFNTEAVDTTNSFVVKENEKTNSINPLSWKRDNEIALKELNKGAVFLNTYGEVTSEINNFTGCYIDSKRGTLKVTDVIKENYNKMKDSFGDGCYHLYDYQFFYNNLKENVSKRIK